MSFEINRFTFDAVNRKRGKTFMVHLHCPELSKKCSGISLHITKFITLVSLLLQIKQTQITTKHAFVRRVFYETSFENEATTDTKILQTLGQSQIEGRIYIGEDQRLSTQ